MTKNVAILGIGNLLMGDEGFGVHVIKHLEKTYAFPENVHLHDAGTAGIYLGPILEDSDWVMVVDVIKSDNPPGTLEYLDNRAISGKNIHTSMSPHQLGILEIIDICRLRGNEPETIDFLCAVPEDISLGLELTETLQQRVAEIGTEITNRLDRAGYTIAHA
ncbi:MAG TPA: hydrogenase maturation protease [Desulfobulbus sp.]|nr:hydrogenase maturation protease [Desulfobulbus sp.]